MPVNEIAFDGFTKEQSESIRKQAISFWEKATTAQEPLFDLINDCERVARVQLPKQLADKYAGVTDMAQLMPADAYKNLRSQAAGLYKLIFSRKPWGRLSIEGKPNERSERIQKAEWVLQNQLDMQNEGSGYEAEAIEAIYQLLYAGITCNFTHWVERWERKPQNKGEIEVKNGRFQFKQEKVAEYAETKHLDIRRVRIDPSVTNLKQRRIVGFESIAQFSELQILKRQPGSYYKFDEGELWKTSFDRDLYYQYVDGESIAYPERGKENVDFGDKLVGKWEIRGMFRVENGDGAPEFHDLIVCIANRSFLIGLTHNPLPIAGWDLFDFPYISPEAGRAFRMGLIEPLMDEFIELFIKRNQSIDEANHATHNMYLADAAATQNLEDYIEHYRGRVIKVDTGAAGLNDVRQAFSEFPRGQSTQDTFKHTLDLRNQIKEGMANFDYFGGQSGDRSETATGVNALVTGGTSILEMTIFLLKISMFSPNWRKTLILYNFFKGDQEDTVYDLKGQAYQVLPNDLNYFYKVDIDVASSIDFPAMVRRFVESYPTMIGDPYWDQFEIRNTLKDVLQLPNGDKLLPPSKYLADIIERENSALLRGVQLFVSEFDPHSAHIQGHVEALKLAQQTTNVAGEPLNTKILQEHIAEHEQMQEAQQEQQGSLGNTKAYGGNSGQNLNSENAANKSVPAAGQQRRRTA